MLLHTVHGASDMYLGQHVYIVEGHLDVNVMVPGLAAGVQVASWPADVDLVVDGGWMANAGKSDTSELPSWP